jgi:hypothetical protein
MKTKKVKTELIFAAVALVARLEQFAAGAQPARKHTMKLLRPANPASTK